MTNTTQYAIITNPTYATYPLVRGTVRGQYRSPNLACKRLGQLRQRHRAANPGGAYLAAVIVLVRSTDGVTAEGVVQ